MFCLVYINYVNFDVVFFFFLPLHQKIKRRCMKVESFEFKGITIFLLFPHLSIKKIGEIKMPKRKGDKKIILFVNESPLISFSLVKKQFGETFANKHVHVAFANKAKLSRINVLWTIFLYKGCLMKWQYLY